MKNKFGLLFIVLFLLMIYISRDNTPKSTIEPKTISENTQTEGQHRIDAFINSNVKPSVNITTSPDMASTKLSATNDQQLDNEAKSLMEEGDVTDEKNLLACLMPKAGYSQYSSYDGGKSARHLLLEDCRDEYMIYLNLCLAEGNKKQGCVLASAAAAQLALKTFNK